MSNKPENQKLGFHFLKNYFFENWKKSDFESKLQTNFHSLELFMSSKCNLSCKYCYLHNFGKDLYPQDKDNSSIILRNLSIFLDWLVKNNMAPYSLEYFSGEPLINDALLDGIDLILEKFKNACNKPKHIIIPSNFTFLLERDKRRKVEHLLQKSRLIQIPIFLSVSIDGKFCDKNRPFSSGQELRDDKFYDEVFKFAKKYECGFHPMIYSNLIEKWFSNFLWFQEKFDEFQIPWFNLYLLEVRNSEWSKYTIIEFSKFIRNLILWTFTYRCKSNNAKFLSFLFDNGGFNILRSPFNYINRGMGCSIQSSLVIRMGDLKIIPCHRTGYPPFELAEFKISKDKIKSIEILNPELLISIYTFHGENQPYCHTCLLKKLCSFGCLGAQFENNGDLFTPIPTVCQLEFVKVWTICSTFEELGILDKILLKVKEDKQFAIKEIIKIGKQLRI